MGRNPGRNYVVTEWDRRRISMERTRRGLSLRAFAERIGCSHHTLWRIERGDISSTPLLRDIYRALRLPLRSMGKPDRDEAELLAAYRQIKALSPARAAAALRELKRGR